MTATLPRDCADVLAVMDVAAPHYPPLVPARAAVAELMKAAERVCAVNTRTRAMDNLLAALARCGGAA